MTESDNIVFCKGWDIVAFTDGGPIFIHPYSIEDVPTISIRRTETGFRLGFNTNHKVRVDPVALGLDGPGFGTLVTDGYMTDNDQAVMLEVPGGYDWFPYTFRYLDSENYGNAVKECDRLCNLEDDTWDMEYMESIRHIFTRELLEDLERATARHVQTSPSRLSACLRGDGIVIRDGKEEVCTITPLNLVYSWWSDSEPHMVIRKGERSLIVAVYLIGDRKP